MKPILCSEMNENTIRRWLDDSLDVARNGEVKQHLRECPSCFSSLTGTISHNLFALLNGGDIAQASSFIDQVTDILSPEQPTLEKDKPIPDLSRDERVILELLQRNHSQEQYGLELVKKSDSRLKYDTIYVTLGRMQEKGLIESRFEQKKLIRAGIPRRLYKGTAFGRRAYTTWFNSSRIEDSTARVLFESKPVKLPRA